MKSVDFYYPVEPSQFPPKKWGPGPPKNGQKWPFLPSWATPQELHIFAKMRKSRQNLFFCALISRRSGTCVPIYLIIKIPATPFYRVISCFFAVRGVVCRGCFGLHDRCCSTPGGGGPSKSATPAAPEKPPDTLNPPSSHRFPCLVQTRTPRNPAFRSTKTSF